MTREVWFQLVGEDVDTLTSADCVDWADDAKVFRLRDAVKERYKDNHLAGIAPSRLTVLANGVALKSFAPLVDLGKDEDTALIVQAPSRFVQLFHDGVNPQAPHLARVDLLDRVLETVTSNRNRFTAEAQEFLMLPIAGLPDKMKNQNFIQSLMHECRGLVGALRISVGSVVRFFAKDPAPSETDLIAYYLSQDCLPPMARCFGSKHTRPTSLDLQRFLIQCLVVAANVVSIGSNLADEDNRCCKSLKKAGILVEDVDGLVRFSSPLAEKYYSKWLFSESGT